MMGTNHARARWKRSTGPGNGRSRKRAGIISALSRSEGNLSIRPVDRAKYSTKIYLAGKINKEGFDRVRVDHPFGRRADLRIHWGLAGPDLQGTPQQSPRVALQDRSVPGTGVLVDQPPVSRWADPYGNRGESVRAARYPFQDVGPVGEDRAGPTENGSRRPARLEGLPDE